MTHVLVNIIVVEQSPQLLLLVKGEVQLILCHLTAVMPETFQELRRGHCHHVSVGPANEELHYAPHASLFLEAEAIIEVMHRALHAQGSMTQLRVDGFAGGCDEQACGDEVAAVGEEWAAVGPGDFVLGMNGRRLWRALLPPQVSQSIF